MSGGGIRPWLSMMRQRVTIAPRTGQDQRGKPTPGTGVEYRARVVRKQKRVVNAQGQEVISSMHAWVAGTDFLPDAQVTLSTADVGSTETWAINPPIVAIEQPPDERGRYFYSKVFFP